MAQRTSLRPVTVINAQSMAVNITSAATVLQSLSEASYQAIWSGTSPVGTLSVQASNDYALNPDGSVANAGHWTTLILNVAGTPSSTIAVSGNTGSVMIDPIETSSYAIRLIYTAGSGTGTLTAIITGKVK